MFYRDEEAFGQKRLKALFLLLHPIGIHARNQLIQSHNQYTTMRKYEFIATGIKGEPIQLASLMELNTQVMGIGHNRPLVDTLTEHRLPQHNSAHGYIWARDEEEARQAFRERMDRSFPVAVK